MKLMLGIPMLDNVSWQFFLFTGTLIGKLARKYDKIFLNCVNRCAIDRAREIIVQDAFARDCDYILFIDDDTLIPDSTVERLLPLFDKNEHVVAASGFCYQRGYKYLPMVYRYEDLIWGQGTPQLIEPFPKEPFRVSATGMGISMLKVSLLKKLEQDLGDAFGRDGPGTEDFYFFCKAYKMGFETWVDPSLEATHLGPAEWINSRTVNAMRTRDHKVIYMPEEDGGRGMKGLVSA